MTMCPVQESGAIELCFYGELHGQERATVEAHLRECRECAAAFDELTVIRTALAARPDLAAPPSGDWAAFTSRLDGALREESRGIGPLAFAPRSAATRSAATRVVTRRSMLGLLATAALLAIVSISVFLASQARHRVIETNDGLRPAAVAGADATDAAASDAAPIEAGLASVGASHLERSKLVVLGLSAKQPAAGAASDWAYERELATSLLNDTRLYRMAAEERGLASLAGVMRDLELVLLQTSMAQASDDTALPQIQRLIRKRGLVQKMDVVGTTGLVP
jgi:hypothetical protein